MTASRIAVPAALIAGVCVLLCVTSHSCFRAFPHSADEYAFLYQARTFLAGRTTNPPLPHGGFRIAHINDDRDRVYSKYPPGWPAVLAVGEAVAAPQLVNPLLGTWMIVCVWLFLRRCADRGVAAAGVLVLGSSSFFVLNSSSFFSHTLCGLSTLIALVALYDYHERPRLRSIVWAASAMAVLLLTRPYTAMLVALPLAPVAAWLTLREARSTWSHAVVGALLVTAGAAVFLVYNAATTGDPLVFGHELSPWAKNDEFTAFDARVLFEAMVSYGAVTLPIGVAIAGGIYLVRVGDVLPRRAVLVALLVVASLFVGHAFRGAPTPITYGPRYQFSAHAVVVVVLVLALFRACRRARPLAWVLVALAVVWQAHVARGHARELALVIEEGSALFRARDQLTAAMGNRRSVIHAWNNSASIDLRDLARNAIDYRDQTLISAARLDPGLHPTDPRFGTGRQLFYWDGAPAAPALLTPDATAAVQGIVMAEPDAIRLGGPRAPGWLDVTVRGDCGPEQRLLEGLVSYAVDRYRGLGPCQGRTARARVTQDPDWSATGERPVVVRRAFVAVRGPGVYVAEGTPGLLVFVDGRRLAQSAADRWRGRYAIELEGTHLLTVVDLHADDGRRTFAFTERVPLVVESPRPPATER